jgi:hypothetical protein
MTNRQNNDESVIFRQQEWLNPAKNSTSRSALVSSSATRQTAPSGHAS